MKCYSDVSHSHYVQIGSFHLKNLNVETGMLFPDEKTQTSERLNYLPKVTQLVTTEPGRMSKLLTCNSGLFAGQLPNSHHRLPTKMEM